MLYEPATPAALADALASLRDPDRRHRLGIAARARAEREYSWQAHCAKLDAAFRGSILNLRNFVQSAIRNRLIRQS